MVVLVVVVCVCVCVGGGEVRGSPYNGLYEEVPPKRGTFFRCVKGHGFH